MKVGDEVLIVDQGYSGNYAGRVRVIDFPQHGWVGCEILEDHHGSQFHVGNNAEFLVSRVVELPPVSSDLKPTNPKDIVGSDKLPLHLWPATATSYGCLGLLDGALKYGRSNWRVAGVRLSIYVDAIQRHTNALFEGEWIDPESGVPHISHILACAAIVADAEAAGKLEHDEQFPGGYRELVSDLTPHVRRLKEKHADKSPKHYSVADV